MGYKESGFSRNHLVDDDNRHIVETHKLIKSSGIVNYQNFPVSITRQIKRFQKDDM